jgi:Saccharopine dehydrogenase NADP binding domain
MSRPPVVGVIGATGAVGAAVVRALAAEGGGVRLRLGARWPDAVRALVWESGPGTAAVAVDVASPATVAGFCAGCDVVVNCVGYLADRRVVAEAALRAGVSYVDAGGDGALYDRLAGRPEARRRPVVLGAGMLPGLSGLVPRWLAGQGLAPPLALTGYVSVLDRMTANSAAEFLASLGDGEGHTSWRSGRRVRGEVEPLHRVRLAFFDGEVTAYPYLGAEAERLARSVPLARLCWYHVFASDGQVLPALGRLREQAGRGAGVGTLTPDLARAAELELFGRGAASKLVFQLDGRDDGRADGQTGSRVAVLSGGGTYEVTGTVCALTVAEVLAGSVPPGVRFAADALDPAVVPRLPGRPGIVGLQVLDGPLPDPTDAEQGFV